MTAPRMIARHALGVLTALLIVLVSVPALAHTLTVGSFNVESGGADIETVASRIALQTDVDLWGLSEVQNASAAEVLRTAMENATGATIRAVVGTTGGADRLVVLLNESRLTFVKHFELNGTIIQACGPKNSRAPLVVEFKVMGLERRMWFMVNHLQRGDADYRHCQARTLNEWRKTNTVRMVAVGDYNFDWDITSDGAQHDSGLDLFITDDRFRWIRPEPPLVRTQCTHDSILDFVFVSGRARQWPAASRILFSQEADYCTKAPTKDSDHRPVRGQFDAQ
jgi:Endonuclease/Exonuclease/phosphatase family